MVSTLFVGIDIGTSRAKGALYDEKGTKLAQMVIPYKRVVTSDVSVEQDAEEWWQATHWIIRRLTKSVPSGSIIRSLAFSTQGGSLVATDVNGLPLAPAILWQDQRGKAWHSSVSEQIGADTIHHKTGWNLGNGLNLLQIIAIRQMQPELFHKARLFLSVADFLSLRLTGRAAVDCSNGGINQLMNINEQKWDEALLNLAGIQPEQLAAVVPSGHVIGTLLPEIAATLNLPSDTVLISGGHDQYCAALGAGAVQASDRLVGTGTAWVLVEIFEAVEGVLVPRRAISRHVIDGLWGALLSLPAGGASLEWFLRATDPFTQTERQNVNLEEMDGQVQQRITNTNRPFFHPCLNGSSIQREKNIAYAAFSQLNFGHDWYDLAAAVMEGVAMQVGWMWEAFPPSQTARPMIMTGGASHSPVWCQLFADVMQIPLMIPDEEEVGCLGAAMLAAGGAGYFKDVSEAHRQMMQPSQLIEPGEHTQHIQKRFSIYKEISQGLYQSAR